MKKVLFFFILMLSIIRMSYSQGCDLPPGCEDKEFPYNFCNSNNLLTICSKNPYNEYDGPTHLIPMKLNGCFIFDYSSYKYEDTVHTWYSTVIEEQHTIIGYEAGTGKPIYGYKEDNPIYEPGTNNEITGYNIGDPIYVPYDIHRTITHYDYITTNDTLYNSSSNIAFRDFQFSGGEYPGMNSNFDSAKVGWSDICSGCDLNNEYLQTCCVSISWTRDIQLFSDRKFDPATIVAFASRKMYPGSMFNCEYECDSMIIILNQTDIFTGNTKDDPGNYKNHFFITGTNSKDDWYSLKATLMHEMGHHLGFGDQYDSDTLDCDYSGSIMGGTDFTNPERGLSADDICMYMKMYCWSPPTTVEGNNGIYEGMRVYPNPTNGDLINVQFRNPFGINMTYEIISPIGNTVSSGDIQYNENPKTIILDNISTGAYYIILKHNGMQETKKFIISK